MTARPTILQKRGRDRLKIICEILEAALDGALRTQIMYKVGLNFANLNSYLILLKERKLLEDKKENGNLVLKTTKRGVLFIQAYRSVRQLFIAEGILKVEKPSEQVIETQSIPTLDKEALLIRDRIDQITLRLINVEKKIDKIYAELKKNTRTR